jgi:protein TonB
MPRDLFGDVTRPSVSIGNRKWYTVPVSLLVVTVVVVVPLLATNAVPAPYRSIKVIFDDVPPPPPPPPISNGPRPVDPLPRPDAAPIAAPEGIAPEKPLEAGFESGVAPTGLVIGVGDPSVVIAPPPPRPPDPVRVGGTIRQPQKVREAAPVYPTIAQAARVQGTVIIEATIGVDGHVANVRVLRSLPLLDEAALEAVRQWQYTPTLLNGVPVPVIMTVTVSFTLSK